MLLISLSDVFNVMNLQVLERLAHTNLCHMKTKMTKICNQRHLHLPIMKEHLNYFELQIHCKSIIFNVKSCIYIDNNTIMIPKPETDTENFACECFPVTIFQN